MKRKIISIFLIALMIISFALTIRSNATSVGTAQEEYNAAKRRKEEVENQLNNATSDLESIQIKVTAAANELSIVEGEINSITSDIEEKEAEIAKTEKDIEAKKEQLKKRLVALYIAGDTSYLDVLVNSENLVDFLSGYDIMQQIADADQAFINNLINEMKELQNIKEDLEKQKSDLEVKKAEKLAKKVELENLEDQKKVIVNGLSEQDKAAQAELDEKEAALNRAKQEAAEAARRAAANGSNTTGSGVYFDGTFIWPCNNKIVTSRMKWRWGRQHKGIDIGASYEYVYAAAAGYAYPLENPGGYGHYVIVVHGDGYATLYGHLSEQLVSSGQYVSQGEVIAISGNTGASTGAHLHFEIRRPYGLGNYFYSDAYDPLNYLPGGYIMWD